jgi:hypothetical protein
MGGGAFAAAAAVATRPTAASETITRILFSSMNFEPIPDTAGAESNLCPKCNIAAMICRRSDSFD